ncbi:hypothetical protein Tco_0477174 [Tanacetum coccineum]
MYDDVSVELKDVEPADEENDDEEMTHAEKVNAEYEEVSQEVAGDQVKDDAQVTFTAAPATQKIEVPLQSSSIPSDYAIKFPNFDNIPLDETKIISMMEIKVQHKNPSIQTPPLLTVHVSVIPESSTALATTIPPPIPPFIPLPQQLTPIPTLTKIEATTSKTVIPDSTTLSAIYLKQSDLEKEYLGTSLDDSLYKVLQRYSTDLLKEHSVPADVVEKLKQQYIPQTRSKDICKSFNKNTNHKALYHALIESILEDEDAMDKGVADKSKNKKPDDADKDEGPPAGPDQGLKRKKIGKETKPSKKAKSSRTSKGTTKSQPKSTGKAARAEETVFEAGDT